MSTVYEVLREMTCDSTYYQNLGDAIAAAWDIFVRDSEGLEVDMRKCWSSLVEENCIEGFCAVAAIEVKDEFSILKIHQNFRED